MSVKQRSKTDYVLQKIIMGKTASDEEVLQQGEKIASIDEVKDKLTNMASRLESVNKQREEANNQLANAKNEIKRLKSQVNELNFLKKKAEKRAREERKYNRMAERKNNRSNLLTIALGAISVLEAVIICYIQFS